MNFRIIKTLIKIKKFKKKPFPAFVCSDTLIATTLLKLYDDIDAPKKSELEETGLIFLKKSHSFSVYKM